MQQGILCRGHTKQQYVPTSIGHSFSLTIYQKKPTKFLLAKRNDFIFHMYITTLTLDYTAWLEIKRTSLCIASTYSSLSLPASTKEIII
ncbi:hypothetical protein Bhyg_17134 [Pseudolycoriella hygida]|uniref:Uncharacterized protein n=1 Tax=Pseudolycoriella hygida TaxID=35572 RepID=A0A9Q0RUB0_9DIPT|nr:hypothetical protein Bhyg_17134 [Pseudolycoriella hygida]